MVCLSSECEVSADEEAVDGAEGCGEHLRWGCPHAKHLDKELHAGVVQRDRANDRRAILRKLWQRREVGNAKGDMAIEPKAREKGYRKDHAQRSNMGRHDDEAQVDEAFTNDVVVDRVVPHSIKHCGSSTTCQIAKNLLRDDSTQRFYIEKIYRCGYECS